MSVGRPGSLLVRRAPDFFIAIYLVVQLALPLSYYLGTKADTEANDERFAWRMFSTRRLASCQVEVEDEEPDGSRRPLPLARNLQEAWVAWLRRGDPTVIDGLARQRCDKGAVAVDYRRTCRSGAGASLPPEERRIPCQP